MLTHKRLILTVISIDTLLLSVGVQLFILLIYKWLSASIYLVEDLAYGRRRTRRGGDGASGNGAASDAAGGDAAGSYTTGGNATAGEAAGGDVADSNVAGGDGKG